MARSQRGCLGNLIMSVLKVGLALGLCTAGVVVCINTAGGPGGPLRQGEGSGTRAPARKSLLQGQSGYIAGNDGKPVAVCPTSEDRDRFVKLSAANDLVGINDMIAGQRVWLVASGTRCLAIDPGVFTSEVRLLDGPRAGQSGFVSAGSTMGQ